MEWKGTGMVPEHRIHHWIQQTQTIDHTQQQQHHDVMWIIITNVQWREQNRAEEIR